MEKLVIIGTGPAGLTAAVYAARADLAPKVLAGEVPGGQLTQTTEVENYPGFPEGILGFDLMDNMQEQAEKFGAEVINEVVTAVEFAPGGVQRLTLSSGTVLEAEAVIIATGARPRKLGIPSEEALWTKGVSSCATCDGAFFRDVPIAVVGGGDSALEEAIFLTRFGSEVFMVHRRDALRGSKIMQDRAFKTEKLRFEWNSVIDEILGEAEGHVTGVRLKDTKTGELREVPCNAVFLAIGHIPNTDVFEGHLAMENGYIVLPDPGRSLSNVEGVFVAGDCADHTYRQAITAAGMGCRAAIDAERYLAARE
jgi:thioredoxin reductase (NADPH)